MPDTSWSWQPVLRRETLLRERSRSMAEEERERDPALMTAYESVLGHHLITSETDWTLQSTASAFDLCLCLFQKPTHSFIKHHFPSEDLLLKFSLNAIWPEDSDTLIHTHRSIEIDASVTVRSWAWKCLSGALGLSMSKLPLIQQRVSGRRARLPGTEDSLSRA